MAALAAGTECVDNASRSDQLVVSPKSSLTFLFAVADIIHIKDISNGCMMASEFLCEDTGLFCICLNVLADSDSLSFDSSVTSVKSFFFYKQSFAGCFIYK